MSKYAKSIAAAVGLIAILSKDVLGVEVPSETVDSVVEGIMALLTWIAIYSIPNGGSNDA